MKWNFDTDTIKGELENAVNDIFLRHQTEEGIESGDVSPLDGLEMDGTIQILAQEIYGILSLQKKASLCDYFGSEIYYTGGGIWCGIIKMSDGNWFSGELNSWGSVYKTASEAFDAQGEGSPDFVRHMGGEDFDTVMNLWKKAISAEKTDMHNLACYTDEWEEEWKEVMDGGVENW